MAGSKKALAVVVDSGEIFNSLKSTFDKPILILSITSSTDRSPVLLREIARKMIKDEVEKVEGVASATISGGLEREIQVEINQDKLESRDVPLLDISKNVSSSNLNYPAGTIKESFYEYLIRTLGEFEEPPSQGAGPMGGTLWRYHLCLDLTPLSSISVDQQMHQQRSL